MKKTTHAYGHKWTTQELQLLIAKWMNEEEIGSIAKHFGITERSMNTQITRMRRDGIPIPRRVNGHKLGRHNTLWTQSEVEYVIRRRNERGTCEEIGAEIGRTYNAINGLINKLRKENVPVPMKGMGVRRLWDITTLQAACVGRNIIAFDKKGEIAA